MIGNGQHIHEDDSHEAIATSIIGTIADHLVMNNGVLHPDSPVHLVDHPNQLVPGASILNAHIKAGRMPGGAEGEMIRKHQDKKLEELKEFEETHIIK